jgi:hypothetical protein
MMQTMTIEEIGQTKAFAGSWGVFPVVSNDGKRRAMVLISADTPMSEALPIATAAARAINDPSSVPPLTL